MATLNNSNFNPAQYGAVPIQPSSTSGFNPQAYGAVPVQTPAKNPWPLQPAAQAVGNLVASGAAGVEQHFVNVAALPVQAIAKAVGKPDPFADNSFPGVNGQGLNVTPLTGEGMLQKAGDAASIALLAASPEIQGIKGLALLGGASGAAQSVAAGNNPMTLEGRANLLKDTGTGILFGAILGGLGNAAKLWSGLEKMSGGISPAMETELARVRPTTLSKYINTAVASAKDYHAQSIDDLVNEDIQHGTSILTEKVIPKAGQAVGAAKEAAGDTSITHVNSATGLPTTGKIAAQSLRDEINDVMQRMTGHQMSSYSSTDDLGLNIHNYPQGPSTSGITAGAEGEDLVEKLPGRPGIEDLPSSDKKALESVVKGLQTIEDDPTVQNASDVVRSIDTKIGQAGWDRPPFGPSGGPIEGFLKYARGAINRTIAPGAPELAKANTVYSSLDDIRKEIGDAAGKDLNHIGLLARRTTYRDQQGTAQSALDGLYDAVKPYLPENEESYTVKSIIGKFARDTFAGERGESGLSQSVTSGDLAGFAGFKKSVVQSTLKVARKVLAPDPAQYAMSIAKGEPYSFVPMMHHIDEFVDSPNASPLIQSFKTGLQKLGVSSSNLGSGAKSILRILLIQQLTKVAPVPLPQQGPLSTPVQSQQSTPALSTPSSPVSSTSTQKNNTAIRSLTPPTTGQGMSSALRTGQLDTMPNGMNLSGSGLSLS